MKTYRCDSNEVTKCTALTSCNKKHLLHNVHVFENALKIFPSEVDKVKRLINSDVDKRA